ncbi:fatty-acid oxidation protein subunit alpha [Aquicoccus sp. SCR17]|nr:fatty-acid oxidation protein subunit alpha [Carideicomes alvinocaridis]
MTKVLDEITPEETTDAPKPPEARNWRLETDAGGIAWLWLDCEGTGTNVISEAVLRELGELVDRLKQEQPKGLVLRSAKETGFAAGADIDGFADMRGDGAEDLLRQGHDVLDRLAALPFPTVAVVHGKALGGGFELALACDHRIAVEGAAFGFPEVQLGLHPGLGGTFRLTRLIDPVEAMTLMLTGKTAHTKKAKKLGLVDAVVPERHVAAAVEAAVKGELQRDAPGMKAAAFRVKPARALAATRMRSETEKRAPREHYPAPYALIDLWEDHGGDPKAMQEGEITSFAKLLDSVTAQNLIRVFFLRRKLKSEARGEDEIAHVHVIGAGTMGAEIAAWAAIHGRTVTLFDVKLDPLGHAMRIAADVCKARHLSGAETRDALDRLMPDPDGLGVRHADLIIEAGPEEVEAKRKIYEGLSKDMKAGAILATNTSSLKLDDLASATRAPSRFAGLHFFNPVSKMPLVEVVSHDKTAAQTRDRLAAFVGHIDRLPAKVTDYPGFLVNRVLTPYLLEAMMMLDEGYTKERIDGAALKFGMPMGPITLADQVGLDICLHVADSLRGSLDKDVPEAPEWLSSMVERGETGKKAGHGLYDWSNGTPHPEQPDELPEDIIDRLILPMCDAGVECLRRDVVKDADTLDAAMIFGTGWAPFRGGPMHYARIRGPQACRKKLEELAGKHGPRFQPDEGWGSIEF